MWTRLRQFGTHVARQRPSRSPQAKVRLEALEDRCLLAVTAITEFPLPPSAGSAGGITAGPDGNVWFTAADNQIGRITPAGGVTLFPTRTTGSFPGAGLDSITTGPDGNLWFTESAAGHIGRLTPIGVVTEFPVRTTAPDPGLGLRGITAGPDGALWFAGAGLIGRITLTGTVALFPLPSVTTPTGGTTIALTQGIAPGPDGNLWFTEYNVGKIGRITATGAVTEFPLAFAAGDAVPYGIAPGPDRNLWFTLQGASEIGRITPLGSITFFALPTAGHPQGITAGPDGALWFAETFGQQIGRITTAGLVSEFALPTLNGMPTNITLVPDGNLWFSEVADRVGRVVVRSGQTPNQLYVMQLYRDLLGREAEAGGLAAWSGLLDQGFPRAQVVQDLEASAEYRGRVVGQLYGRLLGRAPEVGGLAYWIGLLAEGDTEEQVEAGILGTPEYFLGHGGTAQGFVIGLYQDVLQRAPDAGGAQAWTQFLLLGVPRSAVAAAFLTSPESDALEVQGWYTRYLHRPADPAGLAFFTDLQRRGASREQEIALILASDEYFAHATTF